MKNKILHQLQNKKMQIGILFLLTLVITIQNYFVSGGVIETSYNNYLIFKKSFFHLLDGQNLYQKFPTEHYDLFKYSPSFAVVMVVLAYIPDFIGLLIWNLINVFVLYFAFWKLPFISNKVKHFASLFLIIELITTTQNSQSNALIAGLIILGYLALENRRIGLAALFLVATVYIKLFGIVAFVLFLFYPNKIKSALYSVFWVIVIGALPLLFISWDALVLQYQNWLFLLQNDHGMELKFSFAGLLHSWFGMDSSFKNWVLLFGVISFCIPLLNFKKYKLKRFKLLYLASILIWIVIYNHMAESATFILAVTGIAIWYFTKTPTKWGNILMFSTIVLTMLSPSDIFPAFIRNNYFIPYVVKVVPCVIIWFTVQVELIKLK